MALARHTPPVAPPRSRVHAVARAIGVEPERIVWRAVGASGQLAIAVVGPLSPEEQGRLAHVCSQLSGSGVRIVSG